MRTTLDIDDEVLMAAKELARQQHVAVGKVISALARDALTGRTSSGELAAPVVAGFRPFPAGGRLVTNARVDDLRDEAGV